MSFCFSPWTNIDISPTGIISPCCKFQLKHYNEKYNVQVQGVNEYLNSKFLTDVKQQFTQGKWPKGCERCQIEEENSIESKRQLDYQRWQMHYSQYQTSKMLTASIAFGNTCNLKCITCNSSSSSKWHQEYKDIYNIEIKPVQFYRKDFVKQFLTHVPDLIHLDVPGGEPFLSGVKEQLELLDFYISTGQSKNICLHYTTNGTVYPGNEWWSRWQYFKEIDMQLSIDALDNRYEYIRYPASWTTLNNTLDQYLLIKQPNFRLSISHTVSAYNIFYLDEFVQWCYNKGLPRPWMGRVHNPAHMRPSVWPKDIRNKIRSKLEQSADSDVKTWAKLIANTDDSVYWDEFKKYLTLHDQYRNTNFMSVFPELVEFLQ